MDTNAQMSKEFRIFRDVWTLCKSYWSSSVLTFSQACKNLKSKYKQCSLCRDLLNTLEKWKGFVSLEQLKENLTSVWNFYKKYYESECSTDLWREIIHEHYELRKEFPTGLYADLGYVVINQLTLQIGNHCKVVY